MSGAHHTIQSSRTQCHDSFKKDTNRYENENIMTISLTPDISQYKIIWDKCIVGCSLKADSVSVWAW